MPTHKFQNTVTKTANYTLTGADETVWMNSASATTATLPTAVGVNGKEYTINNINTGTCTIATTSSQTINGASTLALSTQYASVSVRSDSANWEIIAFSRQVLPSTTALASLNIPAGTAPTTPVEGDMWSDSTQKASLSYTDGIKQSRPGVLFTQTATATITNTVTETSIIGTGIGSLTLPANFFVAGKSIRLRVGGVYSTPIGTPSVVVKVKLGTKVFTSVTSSSLLSGASSLEFDGEVLFTCYTNGATGTFGIHGDIEYATGAAGTIAVDPLNNGGATVTSVDTTASALLDVTITWDSATSTRIVKSTVCTVEVLN